MSTRWLFALLLALTLIVSIFSPVVTYAQSTDLETTVGTDSDDADVDTNDSADEMAEDTDSVELLGDANEMRSSANLSRQADYVDIGMALFSAQSQTEIDQLSAQFDAALATQPMARNQTRNLQLRNKIIRAITGETTYSKTLPSNAFSSVRKGDILLRRTGKDGCKLWDIVPLCKYWALVYEHAGIYYGKHELGNYMVYESTNIGGVQFKPVITWQQVGQYVGIHRSRTISSATLSRALNAITARYGHLVTPYNYNFLDKNTDSALYCSQLAWKYFISMGVDIDSNSPVYAQWLVGQYGSSIGTYVGYKAVAPDEIGLSTSLRRLYSGWN